MNATDALLKSYFGDSLKESANSRELTWVPELATKFPRRILKIIHEIVVHESDYTTNDGDVTYYATVTFIGSNKFVNYKLDRKVKAENGDRIDPNSVIIANLRHTTTGVVLKNRLFGRVL
jgi:hypothetical protein